MPSSPADASSSGQRFPGELCNVPVVDGDRVAAARGLADRANAVVLLKGPTTIVAAPGGDPVFLNPTGTPLLATAGTGDVLTGIVAAFVARTAG